jgi:hypothetical protein
MSEYQFYAFQALERRLDERARGELRAISSRARITASTFTNHYEWGDLKADPIDLLARYFDVFVYVANWGTHRLALRDKDQLSRQDFSRFKLSSEVATLSTRGSSLILDIGIHELEPDWVEDDCEDGGIWLAALSPLRAQVIAGDQRLFSMLWLSEVGLDLVADEVPMPAPGLVPLNGPLETLAEFLEIDPDLLTAATEARSGAGDLRARAAAIADDRARRAAEKAEREKRAREAEERRLRALRIKHLAERGEAAWDDLERHIAMRNAPGYALAAALLADLRAVAEERGSDSDFLRRVDALRERHRRKGQLIARLDAMELS